MLVEPELTVLQSSKTVCVGTPTRCKITATMPLTAISRERAKLLEAVILQALLPLVPIPLPVTPFHKSPSYTWFIFLVCIYTDFGSPCFFSCSLWFSDVGGGCVYPSTSRYAFMFLFSWLSCYPVEVVPCVCVCVGWELISFLDAVRLSCSRSPYQDQNTSWRTTDWLDFIINCLKNPISNNLCFLNFLLASISKVIKTFALGFHVMYNLSLSFTRMLQ